jgi:hypothetical protein
VDRRLAAEFLAGLVAGRHHQVAFVLDLADVARPKPGSDSWWRRAALVAPGSIAGPGRASAEIAGTMLARRHSAAARWERAEVAVYTNSARP